MVETKQRNHCPLENTNLSQVDYWDGNYSRRAKAPFSKLNIARWVLGKRAVDFLRRGGLREESLADLLEHLGLHKGSGKRLLELGSAPGRRLVAWAQRFGFEPFGVEYTPHGAQLNRETFRRAGIDAQQVFEADLFSSSFQAQHAQSFDWVCSFGLIEHFSDPVEAIAKHVSLIRPEGYLMISIPNLTGLNLRLCRFFHPEVISIHNLAIMQRESFQELFSSFDLEPLFCDYLGLFTLGLQNAKANSQNAKVRGPRTTDIGAIFGDPGPRSCKNLQDRGVITPAPESGSGVITNSGFGVRGPRGSGTGPRTTDHRHWYTVGSGRAVGPSGIRGSGIEGSGIIYEGPDLEAALEAIMDDLP